MKHILTIMFAIFVTSTVWADVEINATNFPDANFRNYLLEEVDVFFSGDGVLTDNEIAHIKGINVSNRNIRSLKGIEYLTALESLSCSSNRLTSLDVSKNTKLTFLSCYQNQLTKLDVSMNTVLTVLYCSNNQLSSLDVSNSTKLIELICHHNQLTTLNVSMNTALTGLYCSNNLLSSLDVSNSTKLIELICHHNQLTSIDVSMNTALTMFSCSNNQLSSVDVSKNTGLIEFDCHHNQLTSIDVANNSKLYKFSCGANLLTTLDVSNNNELSELYCFQNQIKDDAMDSLIESLPSINGNIYVIWSEDEQNLMTADQVDATKAKGWSPYYYDGSNWLEYEGNPDGIVSPIGEMENRTFYSLSGLRIGKPQKGINIVNGRKVAY